MPWIDGDWLDRKCEDERERDDAWRAAHPILWRIRNFIYWTGLLHQ